jgi:hypothetical protein
MYKYKYKYNKYNNKMDNLESQDGGGNKFMENITFIHNTFGYDNLLSILESGVLKLGSKVEKERRKLSGGKPMDNIYMSMYFKDIKNLDEKCGLVFSSNLMNDFDMEINAGWRGKTIVEIKKDDIMKEKKNKIRSVKNFLENPGTILAKNLVDILPKVMMHEVLFFDDIPIEKYLIGIYDCGFSKKEKNDILKILKEKKMNVDILYE